MRNTYTLNESFFRDWSPEMSYLLGYIYADGSMDRGKYRIRFASIDIDQLETVRTLFKSDRPITEASNKNGKWYEFNVQNKQIYSDLRNLGIYPNKSLTMRLPNIPDAYKRDFVRGYFDGDGCVYEVKRKRPTPGMETDFATGSKDFGSQFTALLNDIVGNYFSCKMKRKNYYNIRTNNVGSEKFYETIYYEGCIHLKRKSDKFKSILTKRNYSFLN